MIWLVAEDEADIRMLIMTMISVWGHSTLAFENGQKVWEWIDQIEAGTPHEIPSLILMDIRMPGKRGNEIARRMRSVPAFDRVPIVLMTAFTLSSGDRQEMKTRDGVDHIIQKPLPDFEVLRKLLDDLARVPRTVNAAPAEPAAPVTAEPAAATPVTVLPPTTATAPVAAAPAKDPSSSTKPHKP